MERVAGIEPALSAWKAEVLPLNYTRAKFGFGGGRIRTFEGVSRQIYSLFPLTAREPLLSKIARILERNIYIVKSNLELAVGVEPTTY